MVIAPVEDNWQWQKGHEQNELQKYKKIYKVCWTRRTRQLVHSFLPSSITFSNIDICDVTVNVRRQQEKRERERETFSLAWHLRNAKRIRRKKRKRRSHYDHHFDMAVSRGVKVNLVEVLVVLERNVETARQWVEKKCRCCWGWGKIADVGIWCSCC